MPKIEGGGVEVREIRFRGKRIDNEEWVYGMLCRTFDKEDCITNGYGIQVYDDWEMECYPVIPATVGQFAGSQAHEGDVVKFKYCNSIYIGKVVFNEKTCGFEIWHKTVVGAYGEKATHKMNFAQPDEIEVIGNIHERPHLLGGA